MVNASSNEFPQDRGVGNGIRGHGTEKGKQIEQMLCHGVVGAVGGEGFEQGFGVRAQDVEFEEQAGVEHNVGFFLIGEDILVFAVSDAGPLFEGAFDGKGSEMIVADDAAQQACLSGGDAVAGVDVQKEEGADIDFENVVFGGGEAEQVGVEGMDALEDQDMAGIHAHIVAEGLTLAGGKVEFGQFDFFAGDEAVQVVVEQI